VKRADVPPSRVFREPKRRPQAAAGSELMILAATRDAARLFLELGTVTIVLAVGTRLAARTGFSSIPLYLVAGIVLGALAPPTLDDALVATLSEVGIVLLLFTLGSSTAQRPPPKTTSTPGG